MTMRYKNDGYTAEVTNVSGGVMLTLRDRRGHILRRRRHVDRDSAAGEMWRYGRRWKVA